MSPIRPQNVGMGEYFMFEEEKSLLLDMDSQQTSQKLFQPDESEIIESNNFLREINGGSGDNFR